MRWLLLAAVFLLALPAAAETCTCASGSFNWTSKTDGTPWTGCTADGTDRFVINGTCTITINGDTDFANGDNGCIIVESGGTLNLTTSTTSIDVNIPSGEDAVACPDDTDAGDVGLWVESGGTLNTDVKWAPHRPGSASAGLQDAIDYWPTGELFWCNTTDSWVEQDNVVGECSSNANKLHMSWQYRSSCWYHNTSFCDVETSEGLRANIDNITAGMFVVYKDPNPDDLFASAANAQFYEITSDALVDDTFAMGMTLDTNQGTNDTPSYPLARRQPKHYELNGSVPAGRQAIELDAGTFTSTADADWHRGMFLRCIPPAAFEQSTDQGTTDIYLDQAPRATAYRIQDTWNDWDHGEAGTTDLVFLATPLQEPCIDFTTETAACATDCADVLIEPHGMERGEPMAVGAFPVITKVDVTNNTANVVLEGNINIEGAVFHGTNSVYLRGAVGPGGVGKPVFENVWIRDAAKQLTGAQVVSQSAALHLIDLDNGIDIDTLFMSGGPPSTTSVGVSSSCDAGTDVVTVGVAPIDIQRVNGRDGPLQFSGTRCAGINAAQDYYIRWLSTTTFAVYDTELDARDDTNRVDITGTAAGMLMAGNPICFKDCFHGALYMGGATLNFDRFVTKHLEDDMLGSRSTAGTLAGTDPCDYGNGTTAAVNLRQSGALFSADNSQSANVVSVSECPATVTVTDVEAINWGSKDDTQFTGGNGSVAYSGLLLLGSNGQGLTEGTVGTATYAHVEMRGGFMSQLPGSLRNSAAKQVVFGTVLTSGVNSWVQTATGRSWENIYFNAAPCRNGAATLGCMQFQNTTPASTIRNWALVDVRFRNDYAAATTDCDDNVGIGTACTLIGFDNDPTETSAAWVLDQISFIGTPYSRFANEHFSVEQNPYFLHSGMLAPFAFADGANSNTTVSNVEMIGGAYYTDVEFQYRRTQVLEYSGGMDTEGYAFTGCLAVDTPSRWDTSNLERNAWITSPSRKLGVTWNPNMGPGGRYLARTKDDVTSCGAKANAGNTRRFTWHSKNKIAPLNYGDDLLRTGGAGRRAGPYAVR